MHGENDKRVLVVDDDDQVRQILTTTLVPRGLIVDTAADGREALDLLRANAYAVVLLDLVMPDVDGFMVLDTLDAQPPLSPAVVLVLSGADGIVERLDPKRIHGIVRKPFDPDDLAGLVLACSEVRRRGTFEKMAIATMVSGAPLLAWLNRFGS